METSTKTIFILTAASGAALITGYLVYRHLQNKDEEIYLLRREIEILNQRLTQININAQTLQREIFSNGSISPRRMSSASNGILVNGGTRKAVRFHALSSEDIFKDIVSSPSIKNVTSAISDSGDEEFYDTIENFLDTQYIMLIEDVNNMESKGDINYPLIYNMLSQYDYKTSQYFCLKAKFTRFMAKIEEENENNDKAKHFYFEAHKYAKIAETLDPDDADTKKWCAITLGDITEFVSLSERVKNAMTVKHYAESCLIETKDPLVYHILGRWHFKVASLSWLEHRAAKAICSDFPSSNIEKALEFFTNAEKLKPDYFIGNLLYIAKCHLAMKYPDRDTAFYWLQKARRMTTHNYDERKAMSEVRELLKTHFRDDDY